MVGSREEENEEELKICGRRGRGGKNTRRRREGDACPVMAEKNTRGC